MNDTSPLGKPVKLVIGDPATTAVSVPYLFGFYPQNSLVLVTVRATDPPQLGLAIRIELPPADLHEAAARSLVEPLLVNNVGYAALVLVGSSPLDSSTPPGGWTEPSERGLPHQELVATVTNTLSDQGIKVIHAMWMQRIATGQQWWCYEDPDCGGHLPDIRSTELAVATVLNGDVTLRDRDELVAMLDPVEPETLHRTEAALTQRAQDASSNDVAAALQLLVDAMANTDELIRADGSDRVANLMAALENPDVRTACMTMAVDDRARDAERLWTALTKATPGPWRAEPACLLAVSAYARGLGALARVAVDIALDANPEHSFAQTLSRALLIGLPLRQFRNLLTEATTPPDSQRP